MKLEMNDTIQTISANLGAIGISLTQANEILTFLSLGMAIVFTIYKFIKTKNK